MTLKFPCLQQWHRYPMHAVFSQVSVGTALFCSIALPAALQAYRKHSLIRQNNRFIVWSGQNHISGSDWGGYVPYPYNICSTLPPAASSEYYSQPHSLT